MTEDEVYAIAMRALKDYDKKKIAKYEKAKLAKLAKAEEEKAKLAKAEEEKQALLRKLSYRYSGLMDNPFPSIVVATCRTCSAEFVASTWSVASEVRGNHERYKFHGPYELKKWWQF